MKKADSILKNALALPTSERARLALRLMESLDAEREPESEDALAAKINRRLAEIDAGTAEIVDAKEALKQGRAKLRRRP